MEDVSVLTMGGDECIDLPPGFRFHPTDEEIITHYLTPKAFNPSFTAKAVGQVDLNKSEPWDLPSKAKMGEKEWYFFCQRDRKYPTGMRTNRATEAGYWKATGKDKEIYKAKGCLIGMKKTLVFYKGRAPKGAKTNWVMHEYRLEGKFSSHNLSKSVKDEWVVCRVFHKTTGLKKMVPMSAGLAMMNSFAEDLLDYSSLPPLWDPPYLNSDSADELRGATASTSRPLESSQAFNTSNGLEHQPDYKSFIPNNYPSINLTNPIQNSTQPSGPQISPPNYNPMLPIPAYLHPYKNTKLPNNRTHFGVNGPDFAMLRALAANPETSSTNMQQCKLEQFSNQSILSQDTGLTADMNPEISSHNSKKELATNNKCFDDLECLLNY